VTQEDKAPQRPLRVGGPLGLCVSLRSRPPPSPGRLQKISPGGGRSKPTRPDTQCVRAEQPEDAQASSAPRHRLSPSHFAARPPWTLVHVDHRLATTTTLYLAPLIIYKGWGQPLRGDSNSTTLHPQNTENLANCLLCFVHSRGRAILVGAPTVPPPSPSGREGTPLVVR
jgi:hypothetical protein